MRLATLNIYWVVLLLLAGCASIATPKSIDQQIVYAYSTLASVRTATANLLNRGSIKVEDAKTVQAKADAARDLLDTAQRFVREDTPEKGYDTLMLAQKIIFELEAYLKEREK